LNDFVKNTKLFRKQSKKVQSFQQIIIVRRVGRIGSFAKLGLWVGWCGFANVPMCGWLKLFFLMCVGKNFKNIWVGLRVGLVLPCRVVKERF